MAKKSSSSKSTKSNLRPNAVKFLRLNNGEDIVAEVEELDGSFVVMNPCKVMYISSGKTGFLSISLMQWVFSRICSEQSFELNKRDVLFVTLPNESMTEHYYDSVEHFLATEKGKDLEFDDDYTTEETEDALDLLKEFLNKSKSNKGNLH